MVYKNTVHDNEQNKPMNEQVKSKKNPDPVDVNAGTLLFAMRSFRGMTQKKLGEELGVSFQQVQKYERGANRMTASTLYRASRVLGISVIEFFAGLEGVWPDTGHLWLSGEERELLTLFRSLPGGGARRHAAELVRTASLYRIDGD